MTTLTANDKAELAAGRKELHDRESRIIDHIDGASCEFKAIREGRLYVFREEGFATWADYCVGVWRSTSATINRLIQKEDVIENVSEVIPPGTVITGDVATELADLSPEDQRKAAEKLTGGLKPNRKNARKARADAGLPPKPRKKRQNPDATVASAEDKSKLVSGLFASRTPQMPQDATTQNAARQSPPVVQANGRGGHAGGAVQEWLAEFGGLCRKFGMIFAELDGLPALETHRDMIVEGLRGMAAVVPASIAWTGEVTPTAGDVGAAVATIKRLTAAASLWTDAESVARLADELERAAKILAPEASEPDKKLVTISEEMEQVVQVWNASEQRKCVKLTPDRKNKLRIRLKDQFWRDHWREAIAKADKVPAIKANGCDFDWFLRSDVVVRLVEGKYDDWKIGKGEPVNRSLDADYGQSGRLK